MRQGPIRSSSVLAAIVLFSALSPAQAAMVLVSRDTELSASGPCGTGDTTCTPGLGGILMGHSNDSFTGFGPYSGSVQYVSGGPATQQSSIQSSASGADISVQTAAVAGVFFGAASSAFTLQFSLTAPQQFSPTDSLDNMYNGYTQLVELQGPSGTLFSDSFGSDNTVPVTGLLDAPGMYTLLVKSTAQSQGSSSFAATNLNLQLTPVPLPASIFLALSAAPLLSRIRRRRLTHG